MQSRAGSTLTSPPLLRAPAPTGRDQLPSAAMHAPAAPSVVGFIVGAADFVAIVAAGVAPILWTAVGGAINWHVAALVLPFGAVLGVNLLRALAAYGFGELGRLGPSLARCASAWFLSVCILVAVVHFSEASPGLLHVWLPLWWVLGTALLAAVRLTVFALLQRWRRTGRLRRAVAVVGAGAIGQRLLRRWIVDPDPSIEIVGVYDDRQSRLPPRCMGQPVLGTVDDLIRDARRRRIDCIIVALPLSAARRLSEVMNKLSLVPIDVGLCPDEFGVQLRSCAVSHVGGQMVLNALERPLRDWRWIAKDIEDRVVGTLALAVTAPLLLLIALLIKLDSPGPVLFRQKRYGFNNQLIEVYKFRTMYSDACDPNAEQLTRRNDARVTRLGAVLRRTSLDELPQLINVLRGEMSIVGPRPHALAAKAGALLYQDAVRFYDARHRVKPGITGWAQVNGWRGETMTTEQIARRVEHDLFYIENWSILLDLKIIVRTIFGGLTGRHAY
jgi:Undecaprenyl-phosphate glucose phosphotransferase